MRRVDDVLMNPEAPIAWMIRHLRGGRRRFIELAREATVDRALQAVLNDYDSLPRE